MDDCTLFVDSTRCVTDLCKIGGEMNTDKSPLTQNSIFYGHRKGYTAIYQMLFAPYKNKEFTLAELGIAQGASLKTWRSFFSNKCSIYGFEYYDEYIINCRNMNIPNITYVSTDVSNLQSLEASFSYTNVLFDIIIDDSTHIHEHQNNIIQTVAKYIKPGGMLIIEDINRDVPISTYRIDTDVWAFYTFIVAHNDKRVCPDNDKLLYLVKK